MNYSNKIKSIILFFNDYRKLQNQAKKYGPLFPFGKMYPFLKDRFAQGGTTSGHYFHQDLIVANKIFLNNPIRHVDIGSRIDGFVAHVASFRKIEVIELRPISKQIHNIVFIKKDLMDASKIEENYCDSISSLHAIEHFGLGRYNDNIDYMGYEKGLNNIYKMLKAGGKFYLSLPIGPQRIEFNAHRVFSVKYILEMINKKYFIDSFSYVDDQGDLVENVLLSEADINNNFGCNYGCGIFELTKLS